MKLELNSILDILGLPRLSNEERQRRLFEMTGVMAEPGNPGKAVRTSRYVPIGPVTDRIQAMQVDVSHLRRPHSVPILPNKGLKS